MLEVRDDVYPQMHLLGMRGENTEDDMKIKIVKAMIGWLVKNYKYLVMEAVIPPEAHIHKNPRKREKVMTEEASRAEQDALELSDDVGL